MTGATDSLVACVMELNMSRKVFSAEGAAQAILDKLQIPAEGKASGRRLRKAPNAAEFAGLAKCCVMLMLATANG